MNRKRTKIYLALVRRSENFIIHFIHFARYIIRANFHKFHNINTLSNLRRSDSELHKIYIISNSET